MISYYKASYTAWLDTPFKFVFYSRQGSIDEIYIIDPIQIKMIAILYY